MTAQGHFFWHELMSDDVEKAKAFYTETIGWKTQNWEEGDYTMWMVGERAIGGVLKQPEEAKQMGAPACWMAYIQVDDTDATTKRVEELGGKVLRPAFDVPKVGRIGIFADPQGAAFAVIRPDSEMPAHDGPTESGEFTWNELNTTDNAAAWTFYSALLGWEATESMDMGDMGTYQMFKHSGAKRSEGGMSGMAKTQGVPPHWLYYATVDDLDAAIERITSNGGKVLNGPMEVPGGDKIAQCQDPEGVAFAIHWAKPSS
jgi:predicted enzyme related to lactoylglutathione lyase